MKKGHRYLECVQCGEHTEHRQLYVISARMAQFQCLRCLLQQMHYRLDAKW